MMLKKVLMIALLVIFSKTSILASECKVSHQIMYGIAFNEKHPRRDTGYPYLISFNKKSNLKRIKSSMVELGLKVLDNRTIDCLDENTCEIVTKYLLKEEIKNFDLGAYQIAYIYHKYPIRNYFNLIKNYKDACSIVQRNINKYGYSWESIAKYHSYRKENNSRYSLNLQKNLAFIYPELLN